MRFKTLLLLATVLMSGAAQARMEKPAIGPAPDWVKPVAIPAKPDKADEQPVRILLADQQTRLEPGHQTSYVDLAMFIQTPQGLAAGNLSIPWDPDRNEITVHKLVIHRDGKDIDILASQTFTVLRRETNLENATLDGMLTANIQPEGLQVGDILEYALTITTTDPVFKNHVEQSGAAWNGVPFARAHLRVEWPSNLPINIRQNGALPAVKAVKVGSMTAVELNIDNVQPVIPPRLAPDRYALGRIIEFSDFKSWADVGALMAPLYEKAAAIPASGPLRDEVEKIKAASADPVKRTEAALALVQDRVRYVALLMGAGGYVPATAEETWARRYGDCKAKSALLLAVLHELGVEAAPVAANAISGDGIDARLPMATLFNHVLVRARVGGQTYWLDGTRQGDTSLARLKIPNFGWGLPLETKGVALVRMIPPALDKPDSDFAINIDARAGLTLPAPITAKAILRGDAALGTKLLMGQLTAVQRDEALRKYWKGELSDIDVTKSSASYDPDTGDETLTMEGKANMDWADGWYHADHVYLGFKADFSRPAGPNQDAPFANDFPSYSHTVETIQLPPGFPDDKTMSDMAVDQTVAGTAYYRKASLVDNVFRIEASARSIAPEFAAKDAPAAQKAMKTIIDQNTAFWRPDSVKMTSAELDAAKAEKLTTAKAYVDRGLNFVRLGRAADAKADYDAAIALDPKYVLAFANRAIADLDQNDLKSAQQDIDATAALDPENMVLWHARGRLALVRKAWDDAIAAFGHSIANNPKDSWALGQRAWAYRQVKNYQAERTDLQALLKLEPDNENAKANLITNYGNADDNEASGKMADGIDLKQIKTANLANAIAIIWLQHREPDKAITALARSFELQPDQTGAAALRARAYMQLGKSDAALADVDQGLKLDPKMLDLQSLRGMILFSQGKLDAARKQAQSTIDAGPDKVEALLAGGGLFMNLGDTDKALAAFNAAVKLEPNNVAARSALSLALARNGDNNRAGKTAAAIPVGDIKDPSQLMMLAGAAMERRDFKAALSALNRAIELSPDQPQILSFRAQAHRAAGENDAALADYEAAVKLAPKDASARYSYAELLRSLGRFDDAAAQAQARIESDPANTEAYVDAAVIYGRLGNIDKMVKTIDQGLAIKPTVGLYSARIQYRPWNDFKGREADIQAALRLSPNDGLILTFRFDLEIRTKNYASAVKTASELIAKYPEDSAMLGDRGVAYSKAGETAKADADFGLARAKALTASSLNSLCYYKARNDVALELALQECDAALQKSPEIAAILDSKAFTLLRMGRFDESIATFDKALAKSPDLAVSLYGRAVAWSRKGDKAKAQADRDAALKIDSDVEKDFESFGVSMDAAKTT